MREFSQHWHGSNRDRIGFFSLYCSDEICVTTGFEWTILYLSDSVQWIDTRSTSSLFGDKKFRFPLAGQQLNFTNQAAPTIVTHMATHGGRIAANSRTKYLLNSLHFWRNKQVGSKFKSVILPQSGAIPRSGYQQLHFYAPGLKGPPGASSNWIVRSSIRLSVRLSVLSVIPSRFNKKCNN